MASKKQDGGGGRVDYAAILEALQETKQVDGTPVYREADPTPHQLVNAKVALQMLSALAVHPQGWLRITSSPDGDRIFLKFKWNQGKWRGYYVMAVVQYWQVDYGLTLLASKVAKVAQGESKPAKDTAYDWKD